MGERVKVRVGYELMGGLDCRHVPQGWDDLMTEYFMYKRKERKERNELKAKEIYAGKNKATHSFSKLCRAAGRSDRERADR